MRRSTPPSVDVLRVVAPSPGSASGHASFDEWHADHEEGQLAVDVLDAGPELIVLSTMAGARPDAIEISVHNDLLTIRGRRDAPVSAGDAGVIHRECFWGNFSRTVVLPVDVIGDKARAEYKHGVLSITIPKRRETAAIPVTVVEE